MKYSCDVRSSLMNQLKTASEQRCIASENNEAETLEFWREQELELQKKIKETMSK